jgi:hypothetical protein
MSLLEYIVLELVRLLIYLFLSVAVDIGLLFYFLP